MVGLLNIVVPMVAGAFLSSGPWAAARIGEPRLVDVALDHVALATIADRCALTTTGAVWCWGQNQDGRVGNGTRDFSRIPVPVTGLSVGVTAIAAGGQMCAIQNGNVLCWGAYRPGPPFPETGSLAPKAVPGLPSGITRVAVGESHACIVTNEGAAWCWGENSDGQLGNGTAGPTQPPSPTQVVGLSTGVAQIVAGRNHTCALTTAGSVFCWGSNSSGQLGDGGGGSRSSPFASGITTGAIQVTAAENTTCAVTNDHSGWCWGSNLYGQVGNGTEGGSVSVPQRNDLSGIASVSIGHSSSCAVTTSGGAWCWGRNQAGEVGDGSRTRRLSPVPVTGLTTGVVAVAAGSGKSCAVKSDGTAWCWGGNGSYQLGDGTSIDRLTPVRVNFDLTAPTVTQSPASVSVAEGGTASFFVGATGNPSPAIQWQVSAPGQSSWADLADTTPFNNSPYTGVRTATLTVTNASRSLDGNRYRALITSDLGQAISTPATLTVDYELRISAHPSNQTVVAGQSAAFAVTATVTVPTTYRWQTMPAGAVVWADITNGGGYSGADAAVLSISTSTVALNRRRFRVILTSSAGTATSNAATLTVAGPLVATPSSLRFSATKSGSGALVHVTDPQAITIGSTGETTAWTASADQSWVVLSPGSGQSAGLLTVSIANPNTVQGAATAIVTVTPTTPGLMPTTVSVSLSISQTPSTPTSAPFGQVDTPAQSATGLAGAIAVTGWALDDIGVTTVKVYRNCLNFQPPCHNVSGHDVVHVGDAMFVAGARPDVEAAFSSFPQAYRAGWGLQVLSNMLPRVPDQPFGGQGALTFYVFATDEEGNVRLLGRSQTDQTPTSVTLDNDGLAKPFGTIDTPGQGATVSGTISNFGWVLTPDSNTVADATDVALPNDGSTMTVFIDGAPIGTVAYNQCRGSVGNPVPVSVFCNDDVSNIFGQPTPQSTFTQRTSNPTGFRNLDAGRGAIGAFSFDTRSLTNGMHSIAWGVTDSAGRSEGIGSRNFFVLNTSADPAVMREEVEALGRGPAQSRGEVGTLPAAIDDASPVVGRAGFSLWAPTIELVADNNGDRFVQIEQSGRLELQLGRGVEGGYLVANGSLRDLPLGSLLDAVTGQFTWAPSAAFLGTYRLEFLRGGHRLSVTVTVAPSRIRADADSQVRMQIDIPADGDTIRGPIRIEGWALDPDAFTGTGIGAIHVWARRLDQPTLAPEFLGAGSLAIARPDVAAAFGSMHHSAGYHLTTTLAPGLYEVTVYAWNVRTARWEDARSVRVSVSR